nr:MAG TPA: hypothetical protein [Caudoviricetes sp.]
MTAFASVHSPPIRAYYPLALLRVNHPYEEIRIRCTPPIIRGRSHLGIPIPLGCNSPCKLVARRCVCLYIKERAGADCSQSWQFDPLGANSLPRCAVAWQRLCACIVARAYLYR